MAHTLIMTCCDRNGHVLDSTRITRESRIDVDKDELIGLRNFAFLYPGEPIYHDRNSDDRKRGMTAPLTLLSPTGRAEKPSAFQRNAHPTGESEAATVILKTDKLSPTKSGQAKRSRKS